MILDIRSFAGKLFTCSFQSQHPHPTHTQPRGSRKWTHIFWQYAYTHFLPPQHSHPKPLSYSKRTFLPILISIADYVEKHIRGAVHIDTTRLTTEEFRNTLTSRFKAFNYIFNGYRTITTWIIYHLTLLNFALSTHIHTFPIIWRRGTSFFIGLTHASPELKCSSLPECPHNTHIHIHPPTSLYWNIYIVLENKQS